ncbi:probable serine hydrolase isoform X1 [Halyomorpha halys]|uniref:probable serine hydrolase isoform X1 n=1 Tax=Halyomorpha halys TaxID=286706 RepID=UPI0006D51869|nr:probable serine hydrolase isoform X1 [Halyomorpha halys]
MCSLRSGILRRFSSQRCFHTTQVQRIDPKTVEEIKIPVPWGHIAGKWWRKNEEQPLIALHGLFDNAATFDRLVPLLNENISVLALDLPGFGKSSNPPNGMSPSYLELIVWIRYVMKDYFNWKKINLLGHSFGGNLSFSYSAMFPEEVGKFISIDCSRFNMSSKPEYLLDDLKRGYMGGVVKSMGIPQEGSYELLLDYMYNSRAKTPFKLSKELCELLLSRDLEKISDDVYRNPTDLRPHLKYMGRPTLLFLDALAEKVKCEMLAIRATGGVLVKYRQERLEKQLSIISQNSPRVVYQVVDGGHHVHLENPERVAPIINQFFETSD